MHVLGDGDIVRLTQGLLGLLDQGGRCTGKSDIVDVDHGNDKAARIFLDVDTGVRRRLEARSHPSGESCGCAP